MSGDRSGLGRGAGRGRGRARGRGRSRGIVENIVDVPTISRGRGRSRPKGVAVNPTVVEDFKQATSSNLPTISFMSVAEYYQTLRAPELRHAKDQVSSGADYGEFRINA